MHSQRTVRVLLAAVAMLALPSRSVAQGVPVTVQVDLEVREKGARQADGSSKRGTGGGFHPVVAWLSPIDPELAREAAALPRRSSQVYHLVQKNKEFTPHLLVVPVGSNVEFPNQDPFFHNVFSLFNGKRFDLGLYESGSHRTVRFDREGVSYIFCNIHPEMGAVVISLGTPWFGVSGVDGKVVIPNVPPGNYDLKVWAEGVAPADLLKAERRVRVGETGVAIPEMRLVTSVHIASDHKNKFGEEYRPDAEKPY